MRFTSRRLGWILAALVTVLSFAPEPAHAAINATGLWALSVPAPGNTWKLVQTGTTVEGSTTGGQYAFFSGTAKTATIGGVIWLAQGPPPNIPYQTGYMAAAISGNKLTGFVFWYYPLPVFVPVTGTRLVP